jgi:hypothetical protein
MPVREDSRHQLSAAGNSAFDTSILAFIFVAFVRPDLSDRTFAFDQGLAILHSLFDTRVAINFRFVCYKPPVLQNHLTNGSFSFAAEQNKLAKAKELTETHTLFRSYLQLPSRISGTLVQPCACSS